MEYRKEIDGLRAVAVLPVILFHAGFSWFSGGYVGVDIFFVISGYLITSILLKEMESGTFSIATFYERRARRILPALLFVMICCLPFAYLWMTPQQLKDFSLAFIAVSLFSSNVLFWRKEDYFAPAAEENPLLHTWSLAVEEQFYIVFPLLLIMLWKFGKQPLFYLTLALSCFSLLLAEWGWRNHPSANFYLLPSRAWELGVGALCGFYLYKRTVTSSQSLSLLGLALIIYSIFMFNEGTPSPSLYILVPVAGTAFIIIFCNKDTVTYKLLSPRYMVGIGVLSYSAYLWHQPLMAFARIKAIPGPHWGGMLLLCLLSLLLAYFSWKYVERPFRKPRDSWVNTRERVFSVTAFASLAVFTLGIYGHANEGMPERFRLSKEQKSYISTALASPMREACHASSRNVIKAAEACSYNEENPTVAVLGDSHVVELAYALGEQLEKSNIGVAHFSFSGCGPAYKNNDGSPCSNWTDDTVEYIKRNRDIKQVIVSYRMAPLIWGSPQESYPDLPAVKTDTRTTETIASLRNMLSDLEDSGKEAIFVDQSPELPSGIQSLVYSGHLKNGMILGLQRDWWDAFDAFFEAKDIIPEEVETVGVDDLFCDDEFCYGGKNGISYYFDDDHLSVEGARKVANHIIRKTNLAHN